MTKSNIFAASGRLLLAALFILSGVSKIAAPAATEAYIASAGLPAPLLGLIIAIVVELGAGILLLVGYWTPVVGLTIAAFTVATAIFFHNNFADQNQLTQFLKDFALAGGLLQVAAFGGGSISLDARRLRPLAA